MSIKLISLNIEASNHLDVILPWLHKEQADVICLQEVFETDLPKIKAALNMEAAFAPLLNITKSYEPRLATGGLWGLAMLTKLPHTIFQTEYYFKQGADIAEWVDGQPNSCDRAVLWTTLEKDGQQFTIATTHFTWAPAGNQIPLQDTTYEAMIKILTKLPELVLCGDFNSPRGKGGTFDKLARQYTDNIPPQITTTIDGQFHRAGALELVVDGLFTSAKYQVNNFKIVSGLSDHKAISADILKQE